MYAHAYQSYVWNSVVSRRIREFGLVLRSGDLAVRGVIDTDHTGIRSEYLAKVANFVAVRICNRNRFKSINLLLGILHLSEFFKHL